MQLLEKRHNVHFLTAKALSYHKARQNDIFVFDWFMGNQLMPKFDKKETVSCLSETKRVKNVMVRQLEYRLLLIPDGIKMVWFLV